MELFRFSVLMSVYKNDNPAFFQIALDSIINQSVSPNEIILVIDGPIPQSTNDLITAYHHKYPAIKPHYLKENVGLGKALQIGLLNCTHELVARMDSDDISFPSRFEKQLEAFKINHNLSIVGSNITEFINEETNIIGCRYVPQQHKEIVKYMKSRSPFNHMSVMFKKSCVLKSGNYQHWFYNEDYYLWIRMLESNCVFENLDENLVNVRVGKEMYRRRGGYLYFKTQAKLQLYMWKAGIISFARMLYNSSLRFILQVLMPNALRGWVLKHFARSKVK